MYIHTHHLCSSQTYKSSLLNTLHNHVIVLTVRGNHLSDTTCLRHILLSNQSNTYIISE